MTLLEPTPTPERNGARKQLHLPGPRSLELRDVGAGREQRPDAPVRDATTDDARSAEQHGPDRSERPRTAFPALRFGRIRVLSLAKIATVFSLVGFLVCVGTITLVWNVLLRFGLVESAEEAVATGLGLDEFTIAGGEWFGLVVIGSAVLFSFLLLVTILLTLVYNATCALFGGVAVEAQPVRRPRMRERALRRIRRWREARA